MSKILNDKKADEIRELVAGDDRAFTELVNRYKERIFLVVLRIVRNREEAKDLAQEAFVKAYQNRKSFRAQSGFYTWVYRIAVNLALNYISRNLDRRAESFDDLRPIAAADNPGQNLERRELKKAIDSAIKCLPARQRTVFVLRHYEQKPHSEIASLLSITEGAVKANYHQAVQKLKTALTSYMSEGRITG